jgi:hypothetical protein
MQAIEISEKRPALKILSFLRKQESSIFRPFWTLASYLKLAGTGFSNFSNFFLDKFLGDMNN